MNVTEIGNRYVELCRAGKFDECLETLFSKDAVSVEAWSPPGVDRTSAGMDAIVAKGKWWGDNHLIHKIEVFGPYPNGDRFAVRFLFDITNKPSQTRSQMDEVGLFTVQDGKIVREEFFYSAG